jgi:hypothetical protein
VLYSLRYAGPHLRGEKRAVGPGLHKLEVESTDNIEIFASLKSRKLICVFIIIRNTNEKKQEFLRIINSLFFFDTIRIAQK